MEKTDTRIPPQDLEAERSVLGSVMIEKSAMSEIADSLAPEDFYDRKNGTIYEAIFSLFERREPIDMLTVSSELRDRKMFDQVGGQTYLVDIINSVPTSAHVVHYAKMVKEKKILRDLISASGSIVQSAMGYSEDIDMLLDDIEQKVFSVTNKSVSRNFTHIAKEIPLAYERLERISSGEDGMRGVPTGFINLDNLLSGLQKSDLIILGARPSFGKTSLALDIGRYVATRHGKPVGIFSLEMSKDQVVDRIIASESRLDLWRLRAGKIKSETECEAIQAALGRLAEAPIYIDDTPTPNILEIRRMARRLQAERKDLGLLIVDYLQLIQPRKGMDNPVQQITEISRGLKAIARELSIPVIALSQLSRGVEQRDNKEPRLSDLRDSGSIEQDADVVLFIHPKWKYESGSDTEAGQETVTEIIIAKHRNGPTGRIQLRFNKESACFENLDKRHEPSY